MSEVVTKHPYITQDEQISGGSPVITGTRTRVVDIVIEYEYLGRTADEIINSHPHLTLPQIHDALSYYYEHQGDIDQEIGRRKEKIDHLRKQYQSR